MGRIRLFRSPARALVGALVILVARVTCANDASAARGCRDPRLDLSAIRAVVVQSPERISAALPLLHALGANTLVTHAAPDAGIGRAARAAGLAYIARMTLADIRSAQSDPGRSRDLRAVPNLSGIYFEDDDAVEGYTSPDDQRLAYTFLKELLPGVVVLHPIRLDPIATDPEYLNAIFRPEYTDALVPYFYPVGTTVLGTFSEEADWESVIVPLLAEVRRRAPDKPVFPVLQAFEQTGFPLTEGFFARQLEAYRMVWPGLSQAAAFEWDDPEEEGVLVGFAARPSLRSGVSDSFRALAREDRDPDPCDEPPFSARARR